MVTRGHALLNAMPRCACVLEIDPSTIDDFHRAAERVLRIGRTQSVAREPGEIGLVHPGCNRRWEMRPERTAQQIPRLTIPEAEIVGQCDEKFDEPAIEERLAHVESRVATGPQQRVMQV